MSSDGDDNLRETLNHFKRIRRIPDTALAVISRDRNASISSIGKSDGSMVFGSGILAGSCGRFCACTVFALRLTSDLKLGPSPPCCWPPIGWAIKAVTFAKTALRSTITRDWR